MKQVIAVVAVVVLALPLWSSAALAQGHAGDAALGAIAGAVVLGPVGAVAGAVVGYTAGPSIGRAWRPRRSESSRHRKQSSKRSMQANPYRNPARREASRQPILDQRNAAQNPPPRAANQISRENSTTPAAKTSALPATVETSLPAVQGFE